MQNLNGSEQNYVQLILNMSVKNTKFSLKISFDSRVINFQLLITKYLGCQMSDVVTAASDTQRVASTQSSMNNSLFNPAWSSQPLYCCNQVC